MPKGKNQKRKLLELAKIFQTQTDEDHGLTVQELILRLAELEIPADRKTLYDDIEELRLSGLDIVQEQVSRSVEYRLVSREFELAELKLLVDSVQSAKFITEKKSRELIKKLESLVSQHQAKQLHRQVIISGRVKTDNERIFYNVDALHTAISAGTQIRFHYFQWDVHKEQILRHEGAWYQVSPHALVWDDENYYLIGYDSEQHLKHYRVDKILDIQLTDTPSIHSENAEALDVAKYSGALFGMFGGTEVDVVLRCTNQMAGIIIDRFGPDLPFTIIDPEHFEVTVRVVASPQFIGWVIAIGPGIQVVRPFEIVESLKNEARRLAEVYNRNE